MPASPKLRAWLQLVRPPNLFTVPGDPLAGYFLVSGTSGCLTQSDGRALLTALAALLLYMGGLIGNDVADLEEDRRDRPTRPIPSGQVSRSAAFAASTICAVLGLLAAFAAGLAPFAMACLTQLAIMLYNGGLKKFAIPGALTMGACRGLSFLMGAAVAFPGCDLGISLAWLSAIGVTLYIAGVTWIADRETVEERIGFRRWIPACALLVCFLPYFALAPFAFMLDGAIDPLIGLFLLLSFTAIRSTFLIGRRLNGIPPKNVLGASIGGLIRGLLLVQAAFAVGSGRPAGLITAAVLLAFWPISKAVSRWFYAT
jgi:4-hydroxybenzoate polyprenyltransferase